VIEHHVPGWAPVGPNGSMVPVDTVETHPCEATYQEGAPAAGAALCRCGTYAIGRCGECHVDVCGDHSGLTGGRRLCGIHLPIGQAEKRARDAAAEADRKRAEAEQRQRQRELTRRTEAAREEKAFTSVQQQLTMLEARGNPGMWKTKFTRSGWLVVAAVVPGDPDNAYDRTSFSFILLRPDGSVAQYSSGSTSHDYRPFSTVGTVRTLDGARFSYRCRLWWELWKSSEQVRELGRLGPGTLPPSLSMQELERGLTALTTRA
jgi:hypothetical protein